MAKLTNRTIKNPAASFKGGEVRAVDVRGQIRSVDELLRGGLGVWGRIKS